MKVQVTHNEVAADGSEKKVNSTIEGTVFDKVHPNCLVFSDNNRLFVGDSLGGISVWDIAIRYGNIVAENNFKVTHKELEGDQINNLIVHPDQTNQIFVHSRDNCIRLVEFDSYRGTRIKKRFFGVMCKNLQVRSTISPDGQFLISGSEDGKPRIWDASLEQMYRTGAYECKLLDMVSDCVWNPRYNMFAVCGFG